MSFKYDKLFALLKERGITTYKIRKDNIISQAALTKMKNGDGNIDTRTLERLCSVLHCQPGDIMEYVEDSEEQ
ncbi:MAG: helix-turn-helix transcriptional regulator [Ruminiclostridium sp.]|uniref:helix-turn-helix domain-containing protein n=1 Tax=Ruminococcus sp. TaxID=41978 RepID=UPI0025F4B58A|nr:helix-turn-helix transcriptional regulator [Ruminococcus sp.]MBR1433040.1 helix-turn-helix transcriptional regulator [Ruminococcus sp.]MBR1831054.1 helix-turn-helix transcriptional regulator [Ruminiclostridium sp.]